MNKIDEYIDSIYGNFDNLDKDTKILKEEMRNHLYEEVEELKRQGLSEEESISRALEGFGQENYVVAEMSNVLKSRNIFTKMLVKAGIAVFVTACFFQVASIFFSNESIHYFSLELTKNQLKNSSYLLFVISLALWDIAFYYYYFIKKLDLVLLAFIACDFVICVPFWFVWIFFPQHKVKSMAFIVGSTFIITLIIRMYYIKRKNNDK
ncbi:permease prefix domain 1-containing protein [Clostridium sp. CX1]|uniref:permease prefix domain 1-containing protein n=1 Tax=Clostridium sp. CX1 TaxID=2978346 RepID=UPI0021BE5BC8|nr:permease prefix domain 1-containing protein [Clostridium sp. CX1]MCT8976942.1 permease prefix domain 1-containing protein [Clostridium sp. CX1]